MASESQSKHGCYNTPQRCQFNGHAAVGTQLQAPSGIATVRTIATARGRQAEEAAQAHSGPHGGGQFGWEVDGENTRRKADVNGEGTSH
eukprot:365274-Chlamydomonas_euryale.AAC.2